MRVVVNPPRALYTAAAVAGAALFVWTFILVRFNSAWTFSGWMWDGVWPIAAMGAGLAVAVAAGVRAWQWDYARWTQRHRARAEPGL